MANKRFKRIENQSGFVNRNIEVWVDENTGVQYLFMQGDNEKGGGVCVIVDEEGKPLLAK